MTTYAVQDRSTGTIVHAYEAEQADHFDLFPLETYNHIPQPVPEPVPVKRRVTKLEFVSRLGNDYVPLLQKAKTSVGIEAFIKMIDWATPEQDGTSIDLDDPRVIYALTTIEASGDIAPGRAAEIVA